MTSDNNVSDESGKPREWDVQGAKKILSEYHLPSENIDIGNVFYAATQLDGAFEQLKAENERLNEILKPSANKYYFDEMHKYWNERDELRAQVASLSGHDKSFMRVSVESDSLKQQLSESKRELEAARALKLQDDKVFTKMLAEMTEQRQRVAGLRDAIVNMQSIHSDQKYRDRIATEALLKLEGKKITS